MRHLSILMRSNKQRFGLYALAVVLAAGVATPAPGAPQQPGPPQEPKGQGPIRVGVDLVSLFATVRDDKKRLVADLTQGDFRLFEDGQAQKIEYFSRETTLPITLGLLIDTSISMGGVLGPEQDAASRFLGRVLRKGDLTFVLSFDVNVDLLSDFTEDTGRLERAIRTTRINSPLPDGPVERRGPMGTKLYDAIYLACTEKLGRETGRKAIVVLTDGVDSGSQMKLEDALEVAQRSDTVIHVIGISDPKFYGGGFGFDGEGVSRRLAEETGGRAIFIRSEKKLEEAFDQISEELRSQYTLGYYSSNKARDGKFRKLKIDTTRSGMKVLARKGYYAPRN